MIVSKQSLLVLWYLIFESDLFIYEVNNYSGSFTSYSWKE